MFHEGITQLFGTRKKFKKIAPTLLLLVISCSFLPSQKKKIWKDFQWNSFLKKHKTLIFFPRFFPPIATHTYTHTNCMFFFVSIATETRNKKQTRAKRLLDQNQLFKCNNKKTKTENKQKKTHLYKKIGINYSSKKKKNKIKWIIKTHFGTSRWKTIDTSSVWASSGSPFNCFMLANYIVSTCYDTTEILHQASSAGKKLFPDFTTPCRHTHERKKKRGRRFPPCYSTPSLFLVWQ